MSLVLQDQLFISPKTKEQVLKNTSDIEQLNADLDLEKVERIEADDALKAHIETVEASSDVADLVGTNAALQTYSTSKLTDQAIVCVLADETKEDATTYYRWNNKTNTFNFIGEKGPYYTIRQMDAILNEEVATLNTRITTESATINTTITENVTQLNTKKADLSYVNTQLATKTDKLVTSADGKALIFNEASGGGAQFVNTVKNTISFVGVNNGNDGVFVQIYSKDKASNVGARLNAAPTGIYYTNGKTSGAYTESDELVNKASLAEAIDNIDYSTFATKEELEAGLATKVDEVDVSTFITENELTAGLDTKQDSLTFDNVPTADSMNPVTSKGIKTLVDAKQDIISGNVGEILYHSGTNVFSQSLLNEGMVVATAADLNTCKNVVPSFNEVFDNWIRFSHLNGKDNAMPSEINAWTYDSATDTVIQPKNTESYCGFVSPKSYSSYDVKVRLYATDTSNRDDDQIGLVAAFATDSNGKQHTLSFIRSPWNNSGKHKWICKVDHCTYEMDTTTYNQIILADKTSTVPVPTTSQPWASSTIGIGTVIHMVRNGNVITAACSQFNSTVIDENTRITIDLDILSETYPVLNNFKGAASWGYSTLSQPYSKYENLSVSNTDGYIFDLQSNSVLQFNTKTRDWETIANTTPAQALGAGRLSYNKVTGKLFYCSGSNVFQIATNTNL